MLLHCHVHDPFPILHWLLQTGQTTQLCSDTQFCCGSLRKSIRRPLCDPDCSLDFLHVFSVCSPPPHSFLSPTVEGLLTPVNKSRSSQCCRWAWIAKSCGCLSVLVLIKLWDNTDHLAPFSPWSSWHYPLLHFFYFQDHLPAAILYCFVMWRLSLLHPFFSTPIVYLSLCI